MRDGHCRIVLWYGSRAGFQANKILFNCHPPSSPVNTRTPYEKLHAEQEKGTLPPNLHIQARAKRFDPFGEDADPDNELDKITAFPKSNTIIVDPENRCVSLEDR